VSDTSKPPNFAFQAQIVADDILCFRLRSATAVPTLCSFSTSPICTLLHLPRRISARGKRAGGSRQVEEIAGGRITRYR